MQIRNYLTSEFKEKAHCHDGIGIVNQASLFNTTDFSTKLRFISTTILPSGTSIGIHTHSDNEEIYVILEGKGTMHLDCNDYPVEKGDVIYNKPFGTHGLTNDSTVDMSILVFEVEK